MSLLTDPYGVQHGIRHNNPTPPPIAAPISIVAEEVPALTAVLEPHMPPSPKESLQDKLYDLLVDNGERLQKSMDNLSTKIDKQGQRQFWLMVFMVVGMVALTGETLWLKYSALSVGTGTSERE